jgi:phosphoribosyl-AMP cyclohydrolase
VTEDWLDEIKWDERGLVPAVAQDVLTGRVLMFAWMDRKRSRTAETGKPCITPLARAAGARESPATSSG